MLMPISFCLSRRVEGTGARLDLRRVSSASRRETGAAGSEAGAAGAGGIGAGGVGAGGVGAGGVLLLEMLEKSRGGVGTISIGVAIAPFLGRSWRGAPVGLALFGPAACVWLVGNLFDEGATFSLIDSLSFWLLPL